MRARVGFFFLIPVALFVLGIFVLAFSQTEPKRPTALNPLVEYAPCVATPQLGPNVLTCEGNYHAYHMQDGKPADMGRVTPLRPTPSN